jgi:hypothetical protein
MYYYAVTEDYVFEGCLMTWKTQEAQRKNIVPSTAE